MDTTRAQKLDPFALAKLQAVLSGLLGLAAGILYSFGGLVVDVLVTVGWVTTSETPGLSYGTVLAFGALIGMPIIFAIVGFVLGLAEALLYNVFARWFGGVSVDIEHSSHGQ